MPAAASSSQLTNPRVVHQGWTSWALYNDNPPQRKSKASRSTDTGHCKGVLVWNADHVGWLVHTVPLWPALSGESSPTSSKFPTSFELVENAETYGQSFVWVKFKRKDVLNSKRNMLHYIAGVFIVWQSDKVSCMIPTCCAVCSPSGFDECCSIRFARPGELSDVSVVLL